VPPETELWGDLFQFVVDAPGATARSAAAAYTYSRDTVAAGAAATAAAGHAALLAVLHPLQLALAWLAHQACVHAAPLLAALAAFIALQMYAPCRALIRAFARLPWCRGIVFELAPPPGECAAARGSQQGKQHRAPAKRYVALTIDGGPCPYHTTAALDVLKAAGARATFFITGANVEECDFMGVGCALSGGEGLYLIGSEALKRMVVDGHELANHGW
jgi:hypothetical protein